MSWLVPVGIAAALVLLLASISVPNFTKARTKSMGRSSGTWSLNLSIPASAPSAPASPVPTESSIEVGRLAAEDARRNVEAKELPQQAGEVAAPAAVPAAARPAGPVIVLPSATELASVASTPAAAEGAQHGFDVSGTTKGFYDDSQGPAGGMMGGGRGSGGGVRGDASVQATPGTSSEARATELRVFRLANGDPSETAHQFSRLFPEPTASNSSSQAPMTPFLSRGGSGGQEVSSSTAANVGEPTQKRDRMLAVPDPRTSSVIVTAAKNLMPQIAHMVTELDSDKGRKETVGFYDLQNTDPQDVYNNLQDQFKRSNVRAQNDNQTRLLAQNSPVSQRLRNNTQTTSGGTSTGFGEGGFGGGTSPSSTTPGAGIPERQYPNNPTMGNAYFSIDPETRRLANIEAPPPAAIPPPSALAAPVQETLDKAVLSQSAAGPAPVPAKPALVEQSSVVAGVPIQGLADNKVTGDLTAGLRNLVPGRPAPDVSKAGERLLSRDVPGLITSNQRDQKALGFDLYAGNALVSNGHLAAQAGTAPSEADLASIQEKKSELPPPSEPALSASGTVPLAIKLPAPAFKGMPTDVPVLGDVPAAGRLFRPPAAAPAVIEEAKSDLTTPSQKKYDISSLGVTRAQPEGRAKTEELANYDKENGASRHARSPIVLPGASSETSLALKEGDARDKKQTAAGAVELKVEEKPKSVELFAKLDATASGVEKLHDEFQATDGVAGVSTTPMTAEGLRSLEHQSPLMTADTLRKLESLRIESKAAYIRQAATLDRLKSLGKDVGPEGLAQAIPSAAPDNLLGSLLDQQAVTKQKLTSLTENYGQDSPEVVKASREVEDLRTKITNRVSSVMMGLEARAISLSNSLDNLQKEVEMVTANDNASAARTRPYFEAKRNLEELQRTRQILEKNGALKAAQTNQADLVAPKPAAPAPVPQPEVQTADNAFSTFSLNVSDVSFKLAAASLEKGSMPEPATVRSEEFINAFDYRDPEPPPGVPVTFAWERAQYPFAQNRDLLRFSVKTAALGRQPGRPLNIVLLLDNSGSMERADRVRIIHEALRVLASQLQPQDKFSVVTFARTAHLWVDGVPGNQAAQVAEEVSGLTPQGGTNLEDAMNLAYQTALRHYLAHGINRVVLLTDGAANLGNVEPEALKQKVEANRKQGIALDCFGIGWEGYNDDLLEVLSRNGDGRYAFLNTPEEVASEFAAKLAGALQIAASDVKVQVEFNPERVTAYRQIGYAKHQLTKEQFRDNTVNAAQIGAAEAGNALYAVEVNPAGTGPLCTVRVRFRIPGTTDYREHAWDVPFTGNAVPLEHASPAMRLAATGSAFSEWLASSPYAAEVTPDRLLGYLSGVPEVYGADPRPKKLEWMIRQAKSIAGK